MKKIFILIMLLLLPAVAPAQLVIYNEPFDEMPGYPLTDWHYEFTGMVPWQAGIPATVGACMLPTGGPMSTDVGTNKVACIADCGPWNPNDSNVFSYTPSISLSGITGAWLKYDSYYERYVDGADTEHATVEISTDSGSTWTVIQTVPASSPIGSFTTFYIDLSAYNNTPDLRLGFRYGDGGGHMQGWAIDNIKVFVPARHDVALLSATPTDTLLSYVEEGYGYVHHAQVYNAGLDTIHSFVLNYVQGAGPVRRDTITGISLAPFSTTDIAHSFPDSVFSQGTFPVTMWAALDSDSYAYNDTVVTYIRGTTFFPSKKLAIESGEGTWNGWSPQNMVDLASVAGHDIEACLISVHEEDPMLDTPYHDFLYNLHWNYVPYILFDRRTKVPIDSFDAYLNTQKSYFGFAGISLYGNFDGATATVNATVRPAIDLHGDFRLALVITEDGVTGTTLGYNQVNNFADTANGPMGGYESLPNPVPAAQMVYNYVAREITPSPDGQSGMLPADLLAGSAYNYTLTAPINPSWTTGRLRAIVLLIRHDDSTVLNSEQLPFYLTTTNVAPPLSSAGVYPNPTDGSAKVFFDLQQAGTVKISITDISGALLYQYPVSSFPDGRNLIPLSLQSFPPGIYLINLVSEAGNKTLKLVVEH